MRDVLLNEVKLFLDLNYKNNKPLLLGCSGGPDSSALLYLLAECRRFYPLEVVVAHVDHAWRTESAAEALALKKRVEALGFSFVLKRLEPPKEFRNLEDAGRRARLAFFATVYQERSCQALLLAHQAEEQAETVLKRVLEGAGLMHLGGMEPVSKSGEMVVWRPLLKISKSSLVEFVTRRGIDVVTDPTNDDVKYLRGRMRRELFPEMRRRFGKEVVAPLGQVGVAALELKEYLGRKIAPFLERVESGEEGLRIDLADVLPMEKVELKALIRLICKNKQLSLSFHSVDLLCKLLNNKVSAKKIIQNEVVFSVHRGVLSIKNLSQ